MEDRPINEQALYSRRIKPWLEKVERAGAPLWWRKIHGSAFQRDVPDILFMINRDEEGYRSAHGAVELKNPEDAFAVPTKKQAKELERIRNAGGFTLVSNDERQVKGFFSRLLNNAGWTHPILTEPYL